MLEDRRGIRLLSVNKPLFLAPLTGSKLVYIVWFASNLVLYLVYLLFDISNTYYLENHFVCFVFVFILFSRWRSSINPWKNQRNH
jgi:hypothetical protein